MEGENNEIFQTTRQRSCRGILFGQFSRSPENPRNPIRHGNGGAGIVRVYCSWLLLHPGTNIDGPVQQGPDNDYYLRRDSDGNEDYHGCYFADADAIVSLANLSRNVVIYGHTFTDGWEGGFEQLDKFLDADWAQKHTEIQLEIDGTTLSYEVCSVGICNVQDTSLPIYCNLDDEVFAYLIEDANVRNQISGLEALSTTDQLLTLATCTENNNERLVIVAKQIYDKIGTSKEETS